MGLGKVKIIQTDYSFKKFCGIRKETKTLVLLCTFYVITLLLKHKLLTLNVA